MCSSFTVYFPAGRQSDLFQRIEQANRLYGSSVAREGDFYHEPGQAVAIQWLSTTDDNENAERAKNFLQSAYSEFDPVDVPLNRELADFLRKWPIWLEALFAKFQVYALSPDPNSESLRVFSRNGELPLGLRECIEELVSLMSADSGSGQECVKLSTTISAPTLIRLILSSFSCNPTVTALPTAEDLSRYSGEALHELLQWLYWRDGRTLTEEELLLADLEEEQGPTVPWSPLTDYDIRTPNNQPSANQNRTEYGSQSVEPSITPNPTNQSQPDDGLSGQWSAGVDPGLLRLEMEQRLGYSNAVDVARNLNGPDFDPFTEGDSPPYECFVNEQDGDAIVAEENGQDDRERYDVQGFEMMSRDPTNDRMGLSGRGRAMRPVILDFQNIAVRPTQNGANPTRVLAALHYFKKLGCTTFVVLPRNREKLLNSVSFEQRRVLKAYLILIPTRSNSTSEDDDLLMLKIAHETSGVVVSNDQFRNHKKSHPEWRDLIDKRVLQYIIVETSPSNLTFVIPDSPLGPDGPSVQEILEYSPTGECEGQQQSSIAEIQAFLTRELDAEFGSAVRLQTPPNSLNSNAEASTSGDSQGRFCRPPILPDSSQEDQEYSISPPTIVHESVSAPQLVSPETPESSDSCSWLDHYAGGERSTNRPLPPRGAPPGPRGLGRPAYNSPGGRPGYSSSRGPNYGRMGGRSGDLGYPDRSRPGPRLGYATRPVAGPGYGPRHVANGPTARGRAGFASTSYGPREPFATEAEQLALAQSGFGDYLNFSSLPTLSTPPEDPRNHEWSKTAVDNLISTLAPLVITEECTLSQEHKRQILAEAIMRHNPNASIEVIANGVVDIVGEKIEQMQQQQQQQEQLPTQGREEASLQKQLQEEPQLPLEQAEPQQLQVQTQGSHLQDLQQLQQGTSSDNAGCATDILVSFD